MRKKDVLHKNCHISQKHNSGASPTVLQCLTGSFIADRPEPVHREDMLSELQLQHGNLLRHLFSQRDSDRGPKACIRPSRNQWSTSS